MNKRGNSWILLLVKGALIGTGGILPGISGGVLSVALGVYQPVMALLAHPFRELKARPWFFIPIALGFALGVLGLSRLVDWLFRASPVPAVWLFIGLIAGTLPSLWREAGAKGRPVPSLVVGGAIFAACLAGFLALNRAGQIQVQPNLWVWLLCGVLWGVGLIAPGLSSSSLFIFMGVYQPMAAGIADLDMTVLIPMGIGLAACVLTLSHGMNALLKHCYPYAMHGILAFALASTLAILPLDAPADGTSVAIYALCFAVGLAAALWMGKMSDGMEAAGRKGGENV